MLCVQRIQVETCCKAALLQEAVQRTQWPQHAMPSGQVCRLVHLTAIHGSMDIRACTDMLPASCIMLWLMSVPFKCLHCQMTIKHAATDVNNWAPKGGGGCCVADARLCSWLV